MTIIETRTPVVLRERPHYAATLTTRFEPIARTIVDRVAGLMCTDVWVLDEQELVVASSVLRSIGLRFDLAHYATTQNMLRVPISFQGYSGEVIVGEPLNGERISPRLAASLVQL